MTMWLLKTWMVPASTGTKRERHTGKSFHPQVYSCEKSRKKLLSSEFCSNDKWNIFNLNHVQATQSGLLTLSQLEEMSGIPLIFRLSYTMRRVTFFMRGEESRGKQHGCVASRWKRCCNTHAVLDVTASPYSQLLPPAPYPGERDFPRASLLLPANSEVPNERTDAKDLLILRVLSFNGVGNESYYKPEPMDLHRFLSL